MVVSAAAVRIMGMVAVVAVVAVVVVIVEEEEVAVIVQRCWLWRTLLRQLQQIKQHIVQLLQTYSKLQASTPRSHYPLNQTVAWTYNEPLMRFKLNGVLLTRRGFAAGFFVMCIRTSLLSCLRFNANFKAAGFLQNSCQSVGLIESVHATAVKTIVCFLCTRVGLYNAEL